MGIFFICYIEVEDMVRSISIKDLKDILKIRKINLIDLRDNYLYLTKTIEGAVNAPINFLIMMPDKYLKKDEIYYLFCQYGKQSKKACRRLTELGYKVINVEGGFFEYEASL